MNPTGHLLLRTMYSMAGYGHLTVFSSVASIDNVFFGQGQPQIRMLSRAGSYPRGVVAWELPSWQISSML